MQRTALPAGAPEPVASYAADAHEFLPSPLAGEGSKGPHCATPGAQALVSGRAPLKPPSAPGSRG